MTDADELEITPPNTVDFRNELLRKAIHMCSLSIPIGYSCMTRETALWILIPTALAFVMGDLLRSFHKPSYRLYNRIFGPMLRTHEKSATKKTLNGASWILLSAIVCILVFPKVIAVTAFAILIISDSSAAIIGRRFGTKRYRDKSLQGSMAFVLSGWIVVLFTPKIGYLPGEYIAACVAAIFGAIAEVFSFGIIDDNFAIPVAIGAVLWLSYLIFLPHLNVFLLG